MARKRKQRRLPRSFRAEHWNGIGAALVLIVATLLIAPLELIPHAGALLLYLGATICLMATVIMVVALRRTPPRSRKAPS